MALTLALYGSLSFHPETSEDKLHNKVLISEKDARQMRLNGENVFSAFNADPQDGELTDFCFYYEDGYVPEWA